MSAAMVVMLVWVGGYRGGPTVVQGFETMAACEQARVVLERVATSRTVPDSWADDRVWLTASTRCAELPVR